MNKTANQYSLQGKHFLGLGTAMLAIRFVQAWIYLGGGTRRFFYKPSKLDPHSIHYMGHKLNHAMPGALFGLEKIISYILLHPWLLFFFIILFTFAEFAVGLSLLVGFMTRLAAFGSVILSISLMLIFGWMGTTCLDEWTMASCNFAMGLSLMLSGGGYFSVDHIIVKKWPFIFRKPWFNWLFSGRIKDYYIKRFTWLFGLLAFLFTVGFYSYLHGAVFGPLAHRTDPFHFNIMLTKPAVSKDAISVHTYIDAGPDASEAFIVGAKLKDKQGKTITSWDGNVLTTIAKNHNIKNIYHYAICAPSRIGFGCELGSRAIINLPLKRPINNQLKPYKLILYGIQDQSWAINIP